MNAEQIVSLVVAILTGLAACIPLAVKLVQYIQKAVQEKNWAALLGLVVKLMSEAETNHQRLDALYEEGHTLITKRLLKNY